jgi:hypothetical protein
MKKRVEGDINKMRDEYEPFRETDDDTRNKKVEFEVEHALYVIMDKKAKLEIKQDELMDVIELKNQRIRELEQVTRKLKKENVDLKEAVEEYKASGARRRPKPKPQAPGVPGEKASSQGG